MEAFIYTTSEYHASQKRSDIIGKVQFNDILLQLKQVHTILPRAHSSLEEIKSKILLKAQYKERFYVRPCGP